MTKMRRGHPPRIVHAEDDSMKNLKKIRVTEDGKQFEAYLKFALIERSTALPNPILIGVAYAGSFTACRAVHAALYNGSIEIVDEDTGNVETVTVTGQYRRIETVDGKVTHHFCMPRSSSDEDYQLQLNEMVKNGSDLFPERVVIAPKGNIIEVAGQYIAETFGLPKTPDWSRHYMMILGVDVCRKIDVVSTDLAGEWKNLKAVRIIALKEKDVLDKINEAIQHKVLNPSNTSIMGEGIFQENMTTEEYLKTNAQIIAAKLDAHMKPLYAGDKLSPFIGELKRIPVPAQAKASMGALEVLKHKKGVFLVGDMGTGKSQISLTTVYTYMREREKTGATDGIRVLVIAPSNVLPKWAYSEIPKVIKKHRFTTVMIKSTNDALRYVREAKAGRKVPKGKIEFVLVATDRMKLAAQGFVLGAKWDSYHCVWRSPNTGKTLLKPTKKKNESEEDAIAGWSDVVEKPSNPPTPMEIKKARENGTLLPNGIPMGYIKKWRAEIRNFQDNYSEEKSHRSLARPARKEWGETKGNPRWMIADIFQRHLRNHFHLGIFDEIHQMKASDSGRGVALAKILKSCRRYIFLTGTLTNGSSTSIQSLLWRAFPNELLKEGITYKTSKEQWASRYGVLEKIVTQHESDMTVGVNSNRKKETVIVKEKPGISPKLISTFLLDKCIFVELSDLGLPLVELEETPVIVNLDDDHLDEYQKLHRELYDKSLNLQKELGSAAWSQFNPITLNYADQPQLGAEVNYRDRDNNILATVTAPSFPASYITAKERALVKHIQNELRDNRRCIVFTHFTGEYGTNERLLKVLERNGIRAEIMNDKVGPDERFDWLEERTNSDVEVIIMNQRLVEVGLDLMSFPSIFFYQLNDDINVVRQASRRAWRLAQNKKCKVFFFVANGTNQMVQFQRLMSRRVAAMIAEGRIERSDKLAKYADTSSSGTVAELSKTLSSVELTNAWKSAAAKDIDTNLQLVSEEEFQQRLQEAFERLTAETLAICGYQPSIDDEIDMDALEAAFNEFDKVEKAFQLLEAMMAESKATEEVKVKQESELEKARQKRQQEEEEQPTHFEQLDLFNLLAI